MSTDKDFTPQDESVMNDDQIAANQAATEEKLAEETTIEESVAEEKNYFAEDTEPKKKRKRVRRKDMSPQERKKRRIKDWLITACVFGTVGIFLLVCTLVGFVGRKGNFSKIDSLAAVDYTSSFVLEYDEETGYQTFVGDGDFSIMQLTDIHIGAGALSAKKDSYAIAAVAELVQRMKPDLVIVTGDVAYPVPFQAGTINNKREAEMFATLMEKLGVYWTLTFGNHDTEAYSTSNRAKISEFYSQDKWTKCLYREGPTDEIYGYGNDMILVKNTSGEIVQSIVTLDSNSYTDGDFLGIAWKYDKIHDDQVDWYKSEMTKISNINIANGFGVEGDQVKSMTFFHIPLPEYQIAWEAYIANGHKDIPGELTWYFGIAGEGDEKVYPGKMDGKLFSAMQEVGGQAAFCGHDHLNNFSIDYKGIRLSYGYSIDHLAYAGIWKQVEQRGCTMVAIPTVDKVDDDGNIIPRGSFKIDYERLVK